ncbi:hypothetical protein [Faunimonas sp. B44]|uniref:hypothetical protein n=1 Tax=Faunimonas sp. B44 TaxID=3461493 RepID=UPI004044B5CC
MTCVAAHGSYDVRLADDALQFTGPKAHATAAAAFPVLVLRERAAASSMPMSGADYRFIAHFGVRKRMEFFVNGRLVGTDPCS